jgi:hypothetical protein
MWTFLIWNRSNVFSFASKFFIDLTNLFNTRHCFHIKLLSMNNLSWPSHLKKVINKKLKVFYWKNPSVFLYNFNLNCIFSHCWFFFSLINSVNRANGLHVKLCGWIIFVDISFWKIWKTKNTKFIEIKNSGFCYKNKTSNVFQITGDFLDWSIAWHQEIILKRKKLLMNNCTSV